VHINASTLRGVVPQESIVDYGADDLRGAIDKRVHFRFVHCTLSCGIASVLLVNFKTKKWRLAALSLTIPIPALAIPAMGVSHPCQPSQDQLHK
jgi:hypothetical protein